MSLIIVMVTGALVFSSLTTPHENADSETKDSIIDDDGWEDWTVVTAYKYKKENGYWVYKNDSRPNSKVQRRMSCGERQYRIKLYMTGEGEWTPVTKSPTDDYPYCAYKGEYAWCYRM